MQNRLIVSAIILNDKGEIFLQKRFKPKASPAYLDVWEIPAGGVDDGENVIDAIKREAFEECGLVVEVRHTNIETYTDDKGDIVQVFEPFDCQQMLATEHGLGWVGYVFICKVIGGELKMQLSEAKDPKWVTIEELSNMLNKPEDFFSLQVPVLKRLVDISI